MIEINKNICMLGTRTTSQEWVDMLMDCGDRVIYYVENYFPEKVGDKLHGISIIWYEELLDIEENYELVCGISTTKRIQYIEQINDFLPNPQWATTVHPSASIANTAEIGNGTLIGRGVRIGAHVKIGSHCIIKDNALIGHHTQIGNCVSVAPAANLAGASNIEDYCWIGMGSIIVDHLSVGEGALIAAGAVVINDVPNNVVMMGMPAKIKPVNEEGRAISRVKDGLLLKEDE